MLTLSSKSKKRNAKLDADGELIATSLKRFKITAEAESKTRKQGIEDLEFSIGTGQWDTSVKTNREIEGKPCLTLNRANSFLRQYTGEERRNRPAMTVNPVGNGADLETAVIHQGVLRHIENVSGADEVYDDAYDMMMRIGWSPWRVTTEYVDEMSFDQEPRIRAIDNPFAAYISPVRGVNGQDPLWCHIIQDYGKDEYQADFGKTDMVRTHFPSELGNAEPTWVSKDGVRVAEYWWIELERRTLYQLEDGTTCLDRDLNNRPTVQERETVIRKVCCVKHDAMQVLKRYEYMGKYIPIVEVCGIKLNVDGRIYKAGMVRDYRDAQRIKDFMVTRAVEQVDMVSKDPLWVPKENAQWEEEYRLMNRKNYSHLYYHAWDEQGRQLPPPQRAGKEPPIQAMQELVRGSDYDMEQIIGIYGPGLGQPTSPQESGFAILGRQTQADTGKVPWSDQLNRAIVHEGKIVIDLWPRLVSPARLQRIINPDNSIRNAIVYSGPSNQAAALPLLQQNPALQKAYDVSAGSYDVAPSSGPMYKTGRQESFKALTTIAANQPQLFAPIADIWASMADFPGADLAAARWKKMLPPQLQDDNTGQDKDATIAKLQFQLDAISQQHNQLVAELNRASDTIRTNRLQIESKERIELAKMRNEIVLKMMDSHDAANHAVLQEQLAAITAQMGAMNEGVPIDQSAGPAPNTPELPAQVEPRVQPVMPSAPAVRPQPVNGGMV